MQGLQVLGGASQAAQVLSHRLSPFIGVLDDLRSDLYGLLSDLNLPIAPAEAMEPLRFGEKERLSFNILGAVVGEAP
jgi:hypothetical protein